MTDPSEEPPALDGRPLIGWLAEVAREPDSEPGPVVFVRREGPNVFVREKDPCDPEPERIPIYEGDQLKVMTPVSHTSINTNDTVGDQTGLVLALKLVETRREPGHVYARTLRFGEEDDGRRIHLEPGDSFTIEQLVVELDYIDSQESATESGYVPLTPVLWTWLSIGDRDENLARYLLAAARRLDQANALLIDVENHREALDESEPYGPTLRRHIFALIGAVESTIVALGRAIDMARQAKERIGTEIELPTSVDRLAGSVKAIRDAYEHIEERALGQVFGRPHPDALTIFDHQSLLTDNAIVYGTHRLGLDTDVPELLSDTRQFLKDVARHTPQEPGGSTQ